MYLLKGKCYANRTSYQTSNTDFILFTYLSIDLNLSTTTMLKRNAGRIALIVSLGLYLALLTQECYCTTNSCGESWSGLAILISGAFGFFTCPVGFVWLSNPILFYSWRYRNSKPKESMIASLAAFVFGLSFLLFKRMMVNEGGSFEDIIGYRLGYWLWLSSSAIMLLGNLIVYKQQSILKVRQA